MCSFIFVYFFEENRFFSNYGYYVIIEMIYGVLIVCCICFIFIILKGIDYIQVVSFVVNMVMFMIFYIWRDYYERWWVDQYLVESGEFCVDKQFNMMQYYFIKIYYFFD